MSDTDVTPAATHTIASLRQGLDALATPVLIVDREHRIAHANPASEALFGIGATGLVGTRLARLVRTNHSDGGALLRLIAQATTTGSGFTENELALELADHHLRQIHVACTATPLADVYVILEFHALDQVRKIAREENLLEHQRLNEGLIRNLAHEIKNPLGGIRGAAQLLEGELSDPELREYTQVITKEADRLRGLLDRMLMPHRVPQPTALNIHEVLEHVRSILIAEYVGESRLRIERDYDISLPELVGDREQLIQATLNVARNAAQAMHGNGTIRLVTRYARQLTIAKKRHRQLIEVRVIDNGPGVPPELADKIFYPLVSGRDGGTGLGLSLAQSLINRHGGVIEFESVPGRTTFVLYLPLPATEP